MFANQDKSKSSYKIMAFWFYIKRSESLERLKVIKERNLTEIVIFEQLYKLILLGQGVRAYKLSSIFLYDLDFSGKQLKLELVLIYIVLLNLFGLIEKLSSYFEEASWPEVERLIAEKKKLSTCSICSDKCFHMFHFKCAKITSYHRNTQSSKWKCEKCSDKE